ncbi:hypothetical protein CPter291_2965 [Collimonas pratensis]|uniref:Uncharacterized protein n=1 Tax=Collimonas pratensis TaxID=279113 RepID=A0ABM5Z806_9BURK|nr:hypothetical protein CPter291_2965 [Collimonas pratensis]
MISTRYRAGIDPLYLIKEANTMFKSPEDSGLFCFRNPKGSKFCN